MSLPSPAAVEHAEWPALKQMAESMGLNPKGRSAVVRMRVLDHLRRHARPEPWRAGKEHLAALLTRLGFPERSGEAWESTIQLDAPAPWVGLGEAQLAGGFLREATRSFDRALTMGDAAAHLHRAEALAASGDYAGAVRACELYLAAHPGDVRTLTMQTAFLARAGFAEEASRLIRSMVDSRREMPGMLRAGGMAFLRANRPEAAIAMLTEAVRAQPTDVESHINRGAALLAAGRTQEAIAAFREALDIDPKRAEALNNLGVAHLQVGQLKSAVKYIERAAKLTDSPRIWLNLEKVRGTHPDYAGEPRRTRRTKSATAHASSQSAGTPRPRPKRRTARKR